MENHNCCSMYSILAVAICSRHSTLGCRRLQCNRGCCCTRCNQQQPLNDEQKQWSCVRASTPRGLIMSGPAFRRQRRSGHHQRERGKAWHGAGASISLALLAFVSRLKSHVWGRGGPTQCLRGLKQRPVNVDTAGAYHTQCTIYLHSLRASLS